LKYYKANLEEFTNIYVYPDYSAYFSFLRTNMRLFLEISFRNLYYFLTRKAVRQFNRLAFQYGDDPRYSPRKIKVNGWELQVPDALSFIYQFREILVEESYLFNCNKTNPVIIDCGSNIGLSGIYFANRFKDAEIYCIEADQAIAQTLAWNLKNNGASQVNVIAKAVWTHNDGVHFASEGSDGGSIDNNSTADLIPSMSLKEMLGKFESIDFLKMDIEGAENTVIPDCSAELHKVNQLFIEYHSTAKENQSLGNILSILSNAGFHYYIKTENKRNHPFVNRHENKTYDLQLNIFAYKK
jgi:FkbM family methyltransferase